MIPTSWNEVKPLVQKLNPEFYEVIEEVKPDPNLKLHIVEYPYGEQITDDEYFYVPDGKGQRLAFPKSAVQMFLLEGIINLDFETNMSRISWEVFYPGKVFPIVQHTEIFLGSQFSSNFNTKLTAGARSAYMLQLHSFNEYYCNLQSTYQIPKEFKPTNPLDHYKIFREIAKKEHSPWRVRILMFDPKWLEQIWQNPKWSNVRAYFYKHAFKLANPWYWSIPLNTKIIAKI